ncbi:uncharacterized protein L201_000127 [Kwoniella dendrophila CBS 6074]|uniref:Uncharacterized protein n=1 Tax=Kwoniella dendrophila CBS 6074 TaxID=1295534 RepID=A0AAX4JL68_9TREE
MRRFVEERFLTKTTERLAYEWEIKRRLWEPLTKNSMEDSEEGHTAIFKFGHQPNDTYRLRKAGNDLVLTGTGSTKKPSTRDTRAIFNFATLGGETPAAGGARGGTLTWQQSYGTYRFEPDKTARPINNSNNSSSGAADSQIQRMNYMA